MIIKYQLLLELPSDAELSELEPDVQASVSLLGTYYPSRVAPSSVAIAPRKMMYCVVKSDVNDLLTLLESMVFAYSLDWSVLGLQSCRLIDTITLDGGTNEERIVRVARVLKDLDFEIIKGFLPDRLDSGENPLTPDTTWITKYQGFSPWEMLSNYEVVHEVVV